MPYAFLYLLLYQVVSATPSACFSSIAGPCTMDLNHCGYSSACDCPPGFIYHPALSKCLQSEFAGIEAGQQLPENIPNKQCVTNTMADCSEQLNRCGHPQQCTCPPPYVYNQATGQCVIALQAAQDTSEHD